MSKKTMTVCDSCDNEIEVANGEKSLALFVRISITKDGGNTIADGNVLDFCCIECLKEYVTEQVDEKILTLTKILKESDVVIE